MPSVNLRGMSFEKGLRIFRKKCQNAEIKERCRELQFYEKPNRKKNEKNNYLKRTKIIEAKKLESFELRRKQRHR